MKNRGFTLIELLVVISIIAMLASIVLNAVSASRAKGRDAKRVQELRTIQTAMISYYLSTGTMPANQTPCCGYCDNQSNFMQELVTAGLLPGGVPKSPAGANYCYYNYGAGSSPGALLVVVLEASAPSTTGYPGTCRPWAPAQNWCDHGNNTYYCLCYNY